MFEIAINQLCNRLESIQLQNDMRGYKFKMLKRAFTFGVNKHKKSLKQRHLFKEVLVHFLMTNVPT